MINLLSTILPDILGYCSISYWSCPFTIYLLYHVCSNDILQTCQAVVSTSTPSSNILPCQTVLFYLRTNQWYSTNVPSSVILRTCLAVIFYKRAKQWYSTNVPSSDILRTCQAVLFYECAEQWYSTNAPSSSDILRTYQAVIPIAVVLQGQGMLKCALKVWELIHRLAWKEQGQRQYTPRYFLFCPGWYVCGGGWQPCH